MCITVISVGSVFKNVVILLLCLPCKWIWFSRQLRTSILNTVQYSTLVNCSDFCLILYILNFKLIGIFFANLHQDHEEKERQFKRFHCKIIEFCCKSILVIFIYLVILQNCQLSSTLKFVWSLTDKSKIATFVLICVTLFYRSFTVLAPFQRSRHDAVWTSDRTSATGKVPGNKPTVLEVPLFSGFWMLTNEECLPISSGMSFTFNFKVRLSEFQFLNCFITFARRWIIFGSWNAIVSWQGTYDPPTLTKSSIYFTVKVIFILSELHNCCNCSNGFE